MIPNKLKISEHCIEVTCDRNDIATQNIMASFYPLKSNRILTNYKASPRHIIEILKYLRGVDSPEKVYQLPAHITELYLLEMTRRAFTPELLEYGPKHSPVVNEYLTLDPHQQLGRELAKLHNRFAFFYDTRTGKTPMSYTIMYDDIVEHPEHKWLVVCPLILIETAWMEDCAKFFPDMKVVNCYAKTPAKRIEAINKDGNIYITNTESFVKYREHFDKKGFTGMIVDESSDLKSPSTKTSIEIVDFAQYVKRMYLLSGTPAPNGEYEYYMQMRAIDYYGWHDSYAQFIKQNFIDTSRNAQYHKYFLRPDRAEAFRAAIKKSALYIDKEDVLVTAGRTFNEYEFKLSKDLMEHYNKLKSELYVEVGGTRILTAGGSAKLNKLNQVSSGFIMDTQARKDNEMYNEDKAEWYLLSKERFDVLQELLNSPECVGEQVIIWANYRKEFEFIQEMLGPKCACVNGAVSVEDKVANIKAFKEGKIQYLVANPASADKGLTLTNSHIAIYFSLNWSYELFKQSYDRIYGSVKIQPKHCQYYILIAKGTIDGILYREVLQGKQTASYSILNHLKGDYHE